MTLALALLRLLCERPWLSAGRTLGQIKSAALALVIASLLGAGVWMTVGEISRSSLRSSMPEDVATYWSVHPALSAEMILPLSLGSVDINQDTKDLLYEGREPFLKSLYLGPLVLPLLAGALVCTSIPLKYRVFGAVALVVCLFLALGKYTPAYSIFATLLPPIRIFRFPSKVMLPLSLLASVLAGVGVARLAGHRERRVARAATLVLIAVHASLFLKASDVLAPLINSVAPEVQGLSAAFLERNLLVSLVALSLLSISLAAARPRAMAVTASLAVISTLLLHSGLNRVVARSVLRYKPEHVAALQTPEPSRLYVEDYAHFPDRSQRFLGRSSPFQTTRLGDLSQMVSHIVSLRAMMIPPVGGSWGIDYAWDADLRGLFDRSLREMSAGVRDFEDTEAFLRLLQMANVSHALTLHTSTFGRLHLERTITEPLPQPLYLFKVPDPLPRAYAVSGVLVLPTEVAQKAVLHPAFTPKREVILDGGVKKAASPTFLSSVRIESRGSDRIVLQATLNEPGAVVLLEGFLPGWRATIDDVLVPVHRANALFVAVSAPAGQHRIVFRYRPWTAVVGVTVTLLTALALLMGLARPGKVAELPH